MIWCRLLGGVLIDKGASSVMLRPPSRLPVILLIFLYRSSVSWGFLPGFGLVLRAFRFLTPCSWVFRYGFESKRLILMLGFVQSVILTFFLFKICRLDVSGSSLVLRKIATVIKGFHYNIIVSYIFLILCLYCNLSNLRYFDLGFIYISFCAFR